ncbi:MAG TPA: ABC transporter ATP-binding protein [bacterium]|nr:ABC transporter ATP-binding protein [bacterium]
MIELKNVTKKFGGRIVVDNISFKVNKGEIVGFLGPNGAGKTTTMRMITGFFPAGEGTVKVAGFDMSENPIAAKERIGYMPENVPLYKELDVMSYLKFVARVKGVEKAKTGAMISKAMEEAGITEVKSRIIGRLSKGFRQRVGIAQAILNDPDVLILDEPTSGLDPKQIREIRDLIKEMKGTRTIILSTHILPEVSMTCDKVMVINEGKIVAEGRVDELGRSSGGVSKVIVEVEAPKTTFISEVKKIKGVETVEAEPREGSKYNLFTVGIEENSGAVRDILSKIIKNDWELMELKRPQVTLEDVFLKLVTKEDV